VKTNVAAVWLVLAVWAVGADAADAGRAEVALNGSVLADRVFALMNDYFRDFRHPQTGVVYGARLATRHQWTSPEEVKAGRPAPWGYGSKIEDTALHSGHLLVALLEACQARPAPVLKENLTKTFQALKWIGSLPERYPKPGLPALEGLVPRGPHPDDPAAYYDDSSMDQHTTYVISLARYAASPFASQEDRAWIRQSLQKVGRRLERFGWSIRRGDGVTQAHVGFAWTGLNSHHATILLPTVYALYRGTGDPHWLETYERFLNERDGRRWKLLHPGPHVRISNHPIYANQGAFRVHALCRMESRPERKAVLRGLLKQMAELQLRRDFPGPFYRRFHSEREWSRLRRALGWPDENLHGCDEAWRLYRPSVLDIGNLAVLAHVRFPLGGYHMVLLSEEPTLVEPRLSAIWRMLTTVDLSKVSAGETNYLFTVVGLHLYAYWFRHAADRQEQPPR